MKTKKILRLVSLSVLSLQLFACEDVMPDYDHEKEWSLANFTDIELGDALQIEIMQDSSFRVVTKGENQDLNDLELRVENSTLKGNYRSGSRSHKRTLVQVYLPALKKVDVHSATTTSIKGFAPQQEHLQLIVSGASELSLENSWTALELELSGASVASVSGSATNVSAKVSGNSELKADGSTAINCYIEVNGNSAAKVRIAEKLTGAVNGNSRLIYYGSPLMVQVAVAGDSEMQAIN